MSVTDNSGMVTIHDGLRRRRPRPAVRVAMVLFVAVQVLWPAIGLYIANTHDATVRYAWSMFSRVPEFGDEK